MKKGSVDAIDNTVWILGCRGSVPVSGAKYVKYGGATTCFVLRLAGQLIVVDAGTGILRLGEYLSGTSNIPLLLTHGHVDHLIGLPMCPEALSSQMHFDIYSDCPDSVYKLMEPPLWPVGPDVLPAEFGFRSLTQSFSVGPVSVVSRPGNHPGGVRLLRLTGSGVSVVIMTDCTLDEDDPDLLRFAENCDLLLVDGQYSEEEWPLHSTFGHSTFIQASKFGAACGAKSVRIIHHDPQRSDSELDAAAEHLLQYCNNCKFGQEGEAIHL